MEGCGVSEKGFWRDGAFYSFELLYLHLRDVCHEKVRHDPSVTREQLVEAAKAAAPGFWYPHLVESAAQKAANRALEVAGIMEGRAA